jgi:hypothetical protein
MSLPLDIRIMTVAMDVARRLTIAGNSPEGFPLLRELLVGLVNSKQILSNIEAWFGPLSQSRASGLMRGYSSQLPGIIKTFAASGHGAEAVRVMTAAVALDPAMRNVLVNAVGGAFSRARPGADLRPAVNAAKTLSGIGIKVLEAGETEGITMIGAAHRVAPNLAFPIEEIIANLGRIALRQPGLLGLGDAQAVTRAAYNLHYSGLEDAAARIGTLVPALLPNLSTGPLFDRLEAAAKPATKPYFDASRVIREKGYAAEAADLLIDSEVVSPDQIWRRLHRNVIAPSPELDAPSRHDFEMHVPPDLTVERPRTSRAKPPRRVEAVVDPFPGDPFELTVTDVVSHGAKASDDKADGGEPSGGNGGNGGNGGGNGGDSPPPSRFHFLLESKDARGDDVARGDEVLWGATFDLVFNYAPPPKNPLAEVEGRKLEDARLRDAALRLDVIPAGLSLTDGSPARIVTFKKGKIAGNAPRFHLQAPDKADGEPAPCGVSVTFSVDRHPIYDIFLPIRLVDRLGSRQYADVKLDLDMADLSARALMPRRAVVFISTLPSGNWQIHWNIENDPLDSVATPTTVINGSRLEKAYAANVLNDLKVVAGKPVWKSITEQLEIPDTPALRDAARECMRKAMTAGWTLYELLSTDPVFKRLLPKLNALPDKSRITFKTDGITFPWELLYPKQYVNGHPKENEDPASFWGARFHIESLLVTTEDPEKLPADPEQPGSLFVSMGMNISIDEGWDRMPAPVALQKAYFQTELQKQKRGGYLDQYEAIADTFRQPYPASLLYFFCHGDATKLEFDKLKDPIQPRDIMGESYPGWPVVFLNACEAGNISPLSFYDFRTKFRAKKVFGLIAPSFPIPTLFAAMFARTFLDEYRKRRPLGEILFDLRRKLLERNNPLGLWYSLQCPLDVQAPSA